MSKQFDIYLKALQAGEINAETFADLTMNLTKESQWLFRRNAKQTFTDYAKAQVKIWLHKAMQTIL